MNTTAHGIHRRTFLADLGLGFTGLALGFIAEPAIASLFAPVLEALAADFVL